MEREETEAGRRTPGDQDRHLLVAVDETERSDRVVLYVADFCGGASGFFVTLFHVIAVPQVDIFARPEEREKWVAGRRKDAEHILRRYRDILVQAGFSPSKVDTLYITTENESVADTILEKHGEIGSCTIVLGRREQSRREEFLFGSVSSNIVRRARRCSVWVIE